MQSHLQSLNGETEKRGGGGGELQFLLVMPSETHRHGNKTNPNHGLWVDKLADLKARLHWPVYLF